MANIVMNKANNIAIAPVSGREDAVDSMNSLQLLNIYEPSVEMSDIYLPKPELEILDEM